MDSNGIVRFNNASIAGQLKNYSGYPPGVIPIPGSTDIFNFTSASGGVYLHLTKFLPGKVTVDISSTGEATYQINQSATMSLRDKSGTLLPVQTDSLSFSESGEWMVVDSPGRALLRINTRTLEVLPFGTAFNYSIGLTPTPKTAISNDGRYAFVTSKDFPTFKIYDLSTCAGVPSTINSPVPCQSKELLPYLQDKLHGFIAATNVRFLSDETITFYAASNPTGTGMIRAKYSLTMPGSLTTQMQYLGLGDSFASGEGAYAYKDGTDTDNDKCHLSLRSYPFLIKKDLGYDSADSVACSGAKTGDITNLQQSYKGQVKDGLSESDRGDTALESIKNNLEPGYIGQLEFVNRYRPNVVTISTVGNDIGFSSKIKRCLEPDTCYTSYEDRLEIVREISSKFDDLVSMYQKLKDSAAPNAKVYVIGYPEVVKPGGNCGANVHFNAEELVFATQLTNYLNTVVQRAADNAGVRYVDVSSALYGHRLCETVYSDTAVNGFTAGNDAPDIANVSVIGNESFHPNAMGHRLLEQKILEQTQNFTATNPVPDSSITPPAENSSIDFLSAPHTGRQIYQVNYDDDLSNDVVVRGGAWNFTINGVKAGFKQAIVNQIFIHSDPQKLGEVVADTEGILSGQATIPADIPVGFHTLHIFGVNMAGEPLDTYKTVYVAASLNDLDGDGIPNSEDKCNGVEPVAVDTDVDGVDDACDGDIGPAPAPPTATITNPANNSTLSGMVSIVVNAEDERGIAGVRFKLDGNNLGSEDTTTPYEYTLETKSLANGSHTISATARSVDGLTATNTINVDIQNQVPPPPKPVNPLLRIVQAIVAIVIKLVTMIISLLKR